MCFLGEINVLDDLNFFYGLNMAFITKLSQWTSKLYDKVFKKCFFYMGFTPCKTEQPLQGMESQKKEAQKD